MLYSYQKAYVQIVVKKVLKELLKISRVIVSFLCRHMAGHSSSNFVCRICKDVFANQTLLDQHFLDLHPTKTSHHCVTCNEDFISELFLQIHDTEYHSTSLTTLTKQGSKSLVETKSPRKNKSINSKRFNNSGYLQKIVSNTLAYRDDNLFWCPVCFESYNERENLRDHFRSSHTFGSGSVYVCELCDIEKPSAEMLCWHLEVHSINRLSVNRFSKLRTCVSGIKKEESDPEATFHTGMTDEDTIKTKTKSNNLKIETNTGVSSTRETRLKTDGIEKQAKMGICKKNTVQKLTSGRLKLYISRNQRGLQSQLKTQSSRRSKLNRLASKKLLLKVNNTNTLHMLKNDDEIIGNNNGEEISGSTTEIATKTAKDKSVQKLEGNVRKFIKRKRQTKTKNGILKINVTNHKPSDSDENRDDGRSYVLNDKSDFITNQSLCGNDHFLEVQPSDNTTETQPGEELVDHETREKISQNKADAHLTCKNDSQSPVEAKIVECFVNSHENREDVSSDLINKSILETSFDNSGKQSTFIKSSLSQKGKSRFRNLRSSGPIKHKKLYIINTKKTKGTLLTHKDSNLKCDSQESNKRTVYDTEFNVTAEEESSLVAIANAETHLQPNSIEGSSQCEMISKTLSVCNEDEEISNKNLLKVPEGSVKQNKCQKIPSNVTESSEFEVPIVKTHGNSTDKEESSKIPPDGFKNKTQETCGSSNKDSTTFYFEDEESSKKELDLKSILHNSSSKTSCTVADTLANFESNSSERNVFCSAIDVVSQKTIKKIDSEEILKGSNVKKSGKSSTCEDLKGTVSGKPVHSESEENSQSVFNILENSLEKHNDKPTDDDGSSISIEVETESTSLQSNDVRNTENSHNEPDELFEEVSKSTSSKSNYDKITEDSQNEPNELFEEVSCDKCSLKFYNQDDLFDHIGSHYDI